MAASSTGICATSFGLLAARLLARMRQAQQLDGLSIDLGVDRPRPLLVERTKTVRAGHDVEAVAERAAGRRRLHTERSRQVEPARRSHGFADLRASAPVPSERKPASTNTEPRALVGAVHSKRTADALHASTTTTERAARPGDVGVTTLAARGIAPPSSRQGPDGDATAQREVQIAPLNVPADARVLDGGCAVSPMRSSRRAGTALLCFAPIALVARRRRSKSASRTAMRRRCIGPAEPVVRGALRNAPGLACRGRRYASEPKRKCERSVHGA